MQFGEPSECQEINSKLVLHLQQPNNGKCGNEGKHCRQSSVTLSTPGSAGEICFQ